jgi:tetratricopeptide (TPR) repeat protein
MTTQRQSLHQQKLREAEGYLNLLHSAASHGWIPLELRQPLAGRALELLDRVAEFGHLDAAALFLRGQALRALERYEEAVVSFRRASELNPRNRHIPLALAWCYKRCQRVDLAIEALEQALLIAPGAAILYYNLACYWSLSRNVQRAVSYLCRAFELNPNYRGQVAREPDFDPIRHHPYFLSVTSVIV